MATNKGHSLKLLLGISMLDFPLILRVKVPVVDRIHSQSNNFAIQVKRTRLQVTQNLMPALRRLKKTLRCTNFISIYYLVNNFSIFFNIFMQGCCREYLLINVNCLKEDNMQKNRHYLEQDLKFPIYKEYLTCEKHTMLNKL